MFLLILLGLNREYLSCARFINEEDMDDFLQSIEKLIHANIERELSLRERLKLAPSYFLYAGRVVDFEVVEFKC